jgi:hypothetical protein
LSQTSLALTRVARASPLTAFVAGMSFTSSSPTITEQLQEDADEVVMDVEDIAS